MLLHLQTSTVTAEPAGLAAGRVRATSGPHKGPNVAAGSEACRDRRPLPVLPDRPDRQERILRGVPRLRPSSSLSLGVPDSLRVLQDCFPGWATRGHTCWWPRPHTTARWRSSAPPPRCAPPPSGWSTPSRRSSPPDCWVAWPSSTGPARSTTGWSSAAAATSITPTVTFSPSAATATSRRSAGMTEESARHALGWDLEGARGPAGTPPPRRRARGFTGDHPYLHVAAATPAGRVSRTFRQADGAGNIPSQLLRRLISTASRRPQAAHWNWKVQQLEHGIRSLGCPPTGCATHSRSAGRTGRPSGR